MLFDSEGADGAFGLSALSCFSIHMKKPMSFFIAIVVVVISALVVLSVIKDSLIKTAIEASSATVIGAKIEMGSFSLGLLNRQIHIKDFRLHNPPGFPDQVFLVMPEVKLQVDLGALIAGRMHFPLVVLNMDKMIIFKNKEGKLNVDSLKIIQEQMAANKGKPLKLPVFKIDTLYLNLGKVIMEDYTHAPPVLVEAYDVGIRNQKISDINGLPKLVAAVIVQALKPTAIRSAGLFAAEALLGVGFLPAVAIGIVVAQDDVKSQLDFSPSKVYQESLKLVHDLAGVVKKTDQSKGQITALVYGCDISFNIQDKGWFKSFITIKARKYFLPKLAIANGLLYQLTERLK